MLVMISKIKSFRHSMYLQLCRLLPIQNNKIILWSDNFKSYGCSPKYIAEYLANNYPGKYDLVWVLERDKVVPSGIPEGIRIVRYFSMEYLREISTAKVIVCNARTSDYHFFKKRKGQYYIQTWHSSLRLKKIEGDAVLPETYIENARKDSEKIDLLLSGCRFSTEIFKRAFWYRGEILEAGTPRCDGFFGETAVVRERVFHYFGIPLNKKLVLYAPTFRNNQTASVYGMDFKMLQDALGEEWCIGCRLHPNLNAEVPSDHCIPMSTYLDMQELLIACDLLITDYSSSMFDMAVARKSCVLYTPDYDDYVANERGLYFEIERLPFKISHNMKELLDVIRSSSFCCDYDDFLDAVGSFEEGRASECVEERIEKICGS